MFPVYTAVTLLKVNSDIKLMKFLDVYAVTGVIQF